MSKRLIETLDVEKSILSKVILSHLTLKSAESHLTALVLLTALYL